MASLTVASVLLTVRGTHNGSSNDAARTLHNQTAGNDAAVAAARALGDLSHNVYTPLPGVPGAEADELLFLDIWRTVDGLGTFFGDPQVEQGAAALFTAREAAVWQPAPGAYGFDLPSPAQAGGRYVGMVRGPIGDASSAVAVFDAIVEPALARARMLGQLSHRLYLRMPLPGEPPQAELLGIDIWSDPAGMGQFYASLSGYDRAFSGAPASSVWEQATGGRWVEW